MIIQILANLFEEGYLQRYTVLSPFFAGANVAFRHKALKQVGSYDTSCYSGEDQDMCLRMANAGWDLYFEPKAIVRHKNKMTPRAFVRKWFDYGFYHPYIFKKHSTKGLKIYRTGKRNEDGSIYKRLLAIRFPLHVLIFLTPFLVMHLLLALSISLAIIGLYIPAIIGGVINLAIAAFYFKADVDWRKIPQSAVSILLRYAANLALLLGAFLGGVKLRMLYVSATFDRTS